MHVRAVASNGRQEQGHSWQRVEHASVRARSCARAAHVCALYDGFDAVGVQYGPGYRSLVQAWSGAAMAQLRARATHEGALVHPADLDDALCVSALASISVGLGDTQLPFAADSARLKGAPSKLWAVRRAAAALIACCTDRCCVFALSGCHTAGH